jgi:hypothetical protein
MKWRAPANRELVEAVVATFRDSPERSYERLSTFQYRDWVRTYYWLDASGMALYFLDYIQSTGIESAVAKPALARFKQNLADNRVRSAAMFEEFVTINLAFQKAGVQYANLKGFTLSPDSCPHPSLRCQLDFDFLVDGGDLHTCQSILGKMGYLLAGANRTTWEFKAGSSEMSSMEDYYKPKPQRSVELHFAATKTGDPIRDERLDRLRSQTWERFTFPVLSPADQLIGQALHLFGHLRGECTRPSWVLEYKRHVTARRDDTAFWKEVREQARANRHSSIALGMATLLASRLFGEFSCRELDEWTVDRLPASIGLWAERYGRDVLLADFPGTKLYLLLEGELKRSESSWKAKKRKRLIPLHGVPKIMHADAQDTLWKQLRREFFQFRFILFRLRFHLTQGLRYTIESARWKRLIADLQG